MFHHQRNVAEHWLTLQYWWFYPSIYKHCHRCGVYPWLHIMFLLGFPMVLHIYVCLPKPTLENPIAESPAGDFVLLRCLVATMVLSFGSTFVYFFYTYGEETRHLADFRSRFLGGHKLTLDVGGIILLLISLEVLMGKMGGSNGNKSSINGPFSMSMLNNQRVLSPGWWFGTWLLWLSIHWECHNPNWLIFFRGVGQPPTSYKYHWYNLPTFMVSMFFVTMFSPLTPDCFMKSCKVFPYTHWNSNVRVEPPISMGGAQENNYKHYKPIWP